MKQKGIKGAKLLLNSLWGIICKRNTQKLIVHNFDDDDNYTERAGWSMFNLIPIDKNRSRVFLQNDTDLYDNPLARMKPFFLAKCRLTMAKTIEPYVKDVYYCHTDSILSGIKIPFKKSKGDCGDIKYEGYCKNGFVDNANVRSVNDLFIM